MNNKEAAKALLEGKTLRIKSHGNAKITFKYNFDELRLYDNEGIRWGMDDFNDDTKWEEVKEPYKEVHYVDYNTHWNKLHVNVPPGHYRVTIEEIIK